MAKEATKRQAKVVEVYDERFYRADEDLIPPLPTDDISIDYLGVKYSIKYSKFLKLFESAETDTFSAITSTGKLLDDPLNGPYLSTQQVIEEIYKENNVTNIPDFNEFCNKETDTSNPNTYPAVVLEAADEYDFTLLGKWIMEGKRYSYEDFLEGNSTDNHMIKCGFVRVTVTPKEGEPYYLVRYGIGQLSRWEVNGSMFVSLVGTDDGSHGENTISLKRLANPMPTWPDFVAHIGPVGDDVNILQISNGGTGIFASAAAEDIRIIRFGIFNNQLLNGSRLYYNVTMNNASGVAPNPPTPPTLTHDIPSLTELTDITKIIYNVPNPRYAGPNDENGFATEASGVDYPVDYKLEPGTNYHFAVMAYSPMRDNSDVMYFKVLFA